MKVSGMRIEIKKGLYQEVQPLSQVSRGSSVCIVHKMRSARIHCCTRAIMKKFIYISLALDLLILYSIIMNKL